jgi:hypothetical protein
LHVVRLDFTKCYERINQDKMLEILEQVQWLHFMHQSIQLPAPQPGRGGGFSGESGQFWL